MRSIDVHAHLAPQCMLSTVDSGGEWHGLRLENGDGPGQLVGHGRHIPLFPPHLRYSPGQRIQDMDQQGTDVQVVSIHMPLVGYHLDPAEGLGLAREVNDEISSMTKQWPDRFAGLATLPVQDVDVAIGELERAVTELGLKGAALDTVVNASNWDEESFLPLFKAAEQLGALLFYHPQPNNNLISQQVNDKFAFGNSIGVPLEDALVVAALIFGGVLEKCPDLKVCVAHGGGPACFGMGRMDHAWQVRSEARINIQRPPSTYLNRMYYDTVTNSEPVLRFLIDTVGIDRVVLGSDWPFVGWDPSPAGWVQNLESLTQEEKDKILWQNLEALLGLPS